jgi:large subunit ribosomal protein L25
MKTLTISGKLRKNKGSKDALELRRAGNIPCVLYGGKEQLLFSVEEKQFAKLLYSPDAYLVNLDLEGKQLKAIVKDSQFDKISDKVVHVDFMEAIPGKPLNVNIPVLTTGTAPGVKKGGKLAVKIRQLHVKGLVEDIPDHITLDVNKLDLGNSIKVKDMNYAKLKFLDPANAAVVAVKITREIEEVAVAAPVVGATAAPAAGAAAPAPGAAAPAAAAKKEEKPAAKK